MPRMEINHEVERGCNVTPIKFTRLLDIWCAPFSPGPASHHFDASRGQALFGAPANFKLSLEIKRMVNHSIMVHVWMTYQCSTCLTFSKTVREQSDVISVFFWNSQMWKWTCRITWFFFSNLVFFWILWSPKPFSHCMPPSFHFWALLRPSHPQCHWQLWRTWATRRGAMTGVLSISARSEGDHAYLATKRNGSTYHTRMLWIANNWDMWYLHDVAASVAVSSPSVILTACSMSMQSFALWWRRWQSWKRMTMPWAQ